MSENCTHDCSTCGEACSERKMSPEDFRVPLNAMSSVKKVIAVVSGKGGVGKSMVTSMMAVLMNREGYKTAILDADITGPSIPKAFGVKEKIWGDEHMLFPAVSKSGIKIVSLNLMMENETDPVVWRGPMIAEVVKQFWADALWEDVDYMFVDMPPGTGDVPLTVFQSLPVDGIIIVTSPQELVGMIVAKAVNMAKKMSVPIVGIIENMSYLECPDCHKKIRIFGESHIDETAGEYGLKVLAKVPVNPEFANLMDSGHIEEPEFDTVESAYEIISAIDQVFDR